MGAINAGRLSGIPSRKYLTVKAGAAITKGDVVYFSQSADDGITVLITPGSGQYLPVGIAQSTVTTGQSLRVQTRGLGQVAITSTGTTTAVSDYLWGAINGDVTDVACGSTTDADTVLGLVGLSVATTGAAALAAGSYICMFPHSWWDSGINGGVHAGIPTAKYMTVKAGVAIAKGNAVQWDFATAKDGITVIVAVASTIPIGIAVENAAIGEYFRIQTRGLGTVDLKTDGGAAANDILFANAAGALDDVAIGSSSAEQVVTCAGVALHANDSTRQAAGTYVITCPHSWWEDEDISPVTLGTPSKKYIMCRNGGDTIVAGSVVALSTVADDGYTVVLADPATNIPLGVAVNAAASAGLPVKVQVKGLGDVPITVDAVVAGQVLRAGTPGTGEAETVASIAVTDEPEAIFALALDADTLTVLAAGDYIITCPCAWWD